MDRSRNGKFHVEKADKLFNFISLSSQTQIQLIEAIQCGLLGTQSIDWFAYKENNDMIHLWLFIYEYRISIEHSKMGNKLNIVYYVNFDSETSLLLIIKINSNFMLEKKNHCIRINSWIDPNKYYVMPKITNTLNRRKVQSFAWCHAQYRIDEETIKHNICN